MAPSPLKIKFIENKRRRQSALRKRRATLLEKAKELATLCDVAVAVVIYCQGEAEAVTWPSAAETKTILERFVALPDVAKANMNIEAFMQSRVEKVTKVLDNLKQGNCTQQTYLVLNAIRNGDRLNLDDLPPELAAAVKEAYAARMNLVARHIRNPVAQATAAAPLPPADAATLAPAAPQLPFMLPSLPETGYEAHRNVVASYLNSLAAQATSAAPPPPADAAVLAQAPQEPFVLPPLSESAYVAEMNLVASYINNLAAQATSAAPPPPADAALVPGPQEPLVPPPLTMAPMAVTDEHAPLVAPPLALEAVVADTQAPLVAPPLALEAVVADAQAPLVAPPLAATPPVVPDTPAPSLQMDLDGKPLPDSFLAEMVAAIMDDGSGSNVAPTDDDVQRIRKQHGL